AQGMFWEMYDALLAAEGLAKETVESHAARLGLDADRLADELRRRVHAPRIIRDVVSADKSGVTGTPTFFVNGRRHYGAYDIETLSDAVRAARRRARLPAPV